MTPAPAEQSMFAPTRWIQRRIRTRVPDASGTIVVRPSLDVKAALPPLDEDEMAAPAQTAPPSKALASPASPLGETTTAPPAALAADAASANANATAGTDSANEPSTPAVEAKKDVGELPSALDAKAMFKAALAAEEKAAAKAEAEAKAAAELRASAMARALATAQQRAMMEMDTKTRLRLETEKIKLARGVMLLTASWNQFRDDLGWAPQEWVVADMAAQGFQAKEYGAASTAEFIEALAQGKLVTYDSAVAVRSATKAEQALGHTRFVRRVRLFTPSAQAEAGASAASASAPQQPPAQ